MCTAGEIEAYARSFASRSRSTIMKPNINCNMSSWVNGCEPGWGCKANQKVDLDSKKKEIPVRSAECQPCCEGFFCPHGITCMIRKCSCSYTTHHNTKLVSLVSIVFPSSHLSLTSHLQCETIFILSGKNFSPHYERYRKK